MTRVNGKSPVTAPDFDSGAVTVAYVHGNHEYGDLVTHSWHVSLTELVAWDMSHEMRVIRGGWIAVRCGTDGLVEARNKAIIEFLRDRNSEWLCWIDTDMGFEPDMIDRLVEATGASERKVIGALCFSWRETKPDGMGGFRCEPRPTIFDWRTIGDETGFIGRRVYEPNALMQCGGTGSAAILIHRSVLLAILDKFGPVWYDRIPNPTPGMDAKLIGEDLSFCMRVGAVGVPMFVHTGVPTTHHKSAWVGEMDYMIYFAGQNAMNEPSEPAEMPEVKANA